MSNYWNNRYRKHRGSGPGSVGRFADFKADVVNNLIREYNIESVYDLGCGDGEVASRIEVKDYFGYDPSTHAIVQSQSRMPDRNFTTKRSKVTGRADMTLSLDVIYHLIEDSDYTSYMDLLFEKARKLVCIYSNDEDQPKRDSHVRHRKFSDYVLEHFGEWTLTRVIDNEFPEETWSQFYLYEREKTS